MTIFAKLVRGSTYYLGNKEFKAGVEVRVTEAERDELMDDSIDEETGEPAGAFDRVTVEGEAELRAKFKIREGEAGEAEPEAPAKVRRRKPAND